jgi:hypothetical protein
VSEVLETKPQPLFLSALGIEREKRKSLQLLSALMRETASAIACGKEGFCESGVGLVFGLWSLVFGIWYLVFGIWLRDVPLTMTPDKQSSKPKDPRPKTSSIEIEVVLQLHKHRHNQQYFSSL